MHETVLYSDFFLVKIQAMSHKNPHKTPDDFSQQDPCPTSVILGSDGLGGRQGNNQTNHGLTNGFTVESCACPSIIKPTDLKAMGNRCDQP